MFDTRTLKLKIAISTSSVECPVIGCARTVARQRRTFRREPEFNCPEHGIYISPSTFEYGDLQANLVGMDVEDLLLFARLADGKAESGRMARERSEDALTFNVFRGLERERILDSVLTALTGCQSVNAVPSYWSLIGDTAEPHPMIDAARRAFHENMDHGTEPDLLIESVDTIFVIEAKLGSKHATVPTHAGVLPRYQTAANGWYDSVLTSAPAVVAVEEQLYQLMRCWLLGSWMANAAGKKFVLVSLVSSASDNSVTSRLGRHIAANEQRRCVRATWEGIRELIRNRNGLQESARLSALVDYLDHKSLGYDSRGLLQHAFAPRGKE